MADNDTVQGTEGDDPAVGPGDIGPGPVGGGDAPPPDDANLDLNPDDLDAGADDDAGGDGNPAPPRIERPRRPEPEARVRGHAPEPMANAHRDEQGHDHTGFAIAVGVAMLVLGAAISALVYNYRLKPQPQSPTRLTLEDAVDEEKVPSVTGLQPVGTKGAVWYERKLVPDLTAGSPQPKISFPECEKGGGSTPPAPTEVPEVEEAEKVAIPSIPSISTPAKPVTTPDKPEAQSKPERPTDRPIVREGVVVQKPVSGGISNSIQYRQTPRVREFVWEKCWCPTHCRWEYQQVETLSTR